MVFFIASYVIVYQRLKKEELHQNGWKTELPKNDEKRSSSKWRQQILVERLDRDLQATKEHYVSSTLPQKKHISASQVIGTLAQNSIFFNHTKSWTSDFTTYPRAVAIRWASYPVPHKGRENRAQHARRKTNQFGKNQIKLCWGVELKNLDCVRDVKKQ